jgi:hypothetical protein
MYLKGCNCSQWTAQRRALMTPRRIATIGAQLYSSGAIASYPQVRGVTLTALPTHIVHSAAFGPYGMAVSA